MKSVLAAVALALAGCNGNVDTAELQRLMKEHFETELAVEVGSVNCPDGIPQKKGSSFECTANIKDGPALKVAVEQTNDRGTFEWQLASPVAGSKRFVRGLKRQLELRERLAVRSIDCGGVRASEPGVEFDCAVETKDKTTRTVHIVLGDARTYTWKIAP